MASKKAIYKKRIRKHALNYRWRLLLPTLGGLWIMIAVLALYQYNRENEIRKRQFVGTMERISANVMRAYEKELDLPEFIDFIGRFFSNTTYAGIRISAYTRDGKLIHASGEAIPFEFNSHSNVSRKDATEKILEIMDEDDFSFDGSLFYYMTRKSPDGNIVVLTAMPYTVAINNTLSRRNHIWLVIGPIAFIASLMLILCVNHFTKSVRLLAEFADNASNNIRPSKSYDFPNDEVGEISRRIIQLYRDKADAINEKDREHTIALNAINEKARFKREMTNNINHELKTPLGIIKGYIDTIMAQPDMDTDTIRHFLSRAQSNVDRLTNLMNDVSTITRLDDGLNQISVSAVNFHDLVYTIHDDISNSGILGDMTFTYDIPLSTIVRGNVQLLQSVILNLIRNGVRHSHGTLMRLEQTGESDRFYSFRFYDDGVGVSEDQIGRIFDRFYRADQGRSRKTGDTGLGLAIVSDTIHRLGGAISAKNRSTGGLEFNFTLEKWTFRNS